MQFQVRNLTLAGWLLALVSIGVIVLVSIPVGQWALDHIGRSALRAWTSWFVMLLSLAGLAAGVTSFEVGRRLLSLWGVRLWRPARSAGPGRYDDWILLAVVLGLNLLVWGAFFLFLAE